MPRQTAAQLQAQLQASLQALRDCQQALRDSQAREQLALQQAGRDALTGLPNRRALDQQAARALAGHREHGGGFGLLFMDLDGFKAINDQLGHDTGDAVLRLVGARLVHALRGDDGVSRLGGDEFVCLLPQVQQPAQALAIARKLMATVALPCQLGRLTVQVQASVGVALYPDHGRTVPALLRSADQAMLRAKRQRQGPLLALSDDAAGEGRGLPALAPPAAGRLSAPAGPADR